MDRRHQDIQAWPHTNRAVLTFGAYLEDTRSEQGRSRRCRGPGAGRSTTSFGNTASRRVAEKVGALREGIAHDRLYLHGRSHDAVVYALPRSRHGGNGGR